MEWWLALIYIFGGLLVIMMLGIPFVVCFILVDLVGGFLLMGGTGGMNLLVLSMFKSVASFTVLPLPLFILMGEVMFQSGIAPLMMKAIDVWLGRLPGRLSLLAIAAGTVLAFLTGVSMASVAILGSTMLPDMKERGYKKPMIIGPILGAGGLAVLIPPSALAVLIGVVADVSIGKLLIGIIIPGLFLAALLALYVVIRGWLQPHLAPPYYAPPTPLSEKIKLTAQNILPLLIIVFLVTGVILLGIATPTEAAATGALGTVLLVAAYKRLSWKVISRSVVRTASVTIMIMMLVAGASAFSQLVAFSGVSRGLAEFVRDLPAPPIVMFLLMQVAALFLGMFVNTSTVVMVLVPLFMPAVTALHFDPVWFGVVFLISTEVGLISPPYGACLFVLKGLTPPDITMGDIYRGALPFIYLDIFAIVLIAFFPQIALWLPGLMR